MTALTTNYLSIEDYLQWEEKQEEKHEYVDGTIYAMAGATENHVSITAISHQYCDRIFAVIIAEPFPQT